MNVQNSKFINFIWFLWRIFFSFHNRFCFLKVQIVCCGICNKLSLHTFLILIRSRVISICLHKHGKQIDNGKFELLKSNIGCKMERILQKKLGKLQIVKKNVYRKSVFRSSSNLNFREIF